MSDPPHTHPTLNGWPNSFRERGCATTPEPIAKGGLIAWPGGVHYWCTACEKCQHNIKTFCLQRPWRPVFPVLFCQSDAPPLGGGGGIAKGGRGGGGGSTAIPTDITGHHTLRIGSGPSGTKDTTSCTRSANRDAQRRAHPTQPTRLQQEYSLHHDGKPSPPSARGPWCGRTGRQQPPRRTPFATTPKTPS